MAKAAYCGVGGKAHKIKKFYVGIGGKARKVKKFYVGVGGKARLFWSSGLRFQGMIAVNPSVENNSDPIKNIEFRDFNTYALKNTLIPGENSSPTNGSLYILPAFASSPERFFRFEARMGYYTTSTIYGIREIDQYTGATIKYKSGSDLANDTGISQNRSQAPRINAAENNYVITGGRYAYTSSSNDGHQTRNPETLAILYSHRGFLAYYPSVLGTISSSGFVMTAREGNSDDGYYKIIYEFDKITFSNIRRVGIGESSEQFGRYYGSAGGKTIQSGPNKNDGYDDPTTYYDKIYELNQSTTAIVRTIHSVRYTDEHSYYAYNAHWNPGLMY